MNHLFPLRRLVAFGCAALLAATGGFAREARGSELSAADQRWVKKTLAGMSLEEKAAQMMCIWQEKAVKLVDGAGNFDLAKARAAFSPMWRIPRPKITRPASNSWFT